MNIRIISMLLCLVFGTAVADTYGDWETANVSGFASAGTTTESGSSFGQSCEIKTNGVCFWYIGITNSCVAGQKYQMLLNSDVGSAEVEMTCDQYMPQTQHYRYVFTEYNVIDGFVRKGTRLSFSFPQISGTIFSFPL